MVRPLTMTESRSAMHRNTVTRAPRWALIVAVVLIGAAVAGLIYRWFEE